MYPGLIRTFNIHNPQMAIFFGQTESETHDKRTPPRPEFSSGISGRDTVCTSNTDALRCAVHSNLQRCWNSRTIDLTLLVVPTEPSQAAGWTCEFVCSILLLFPLRDQKEFFLPERQDNTRLSIATAEPIDVITLASFDIHTPVLEFDCTYCSRVCRWNRY